MKSEKLVIKKMGINGEGIGYIDQKIAFIKGALTGEEVFASVTYSSSNIVIKINSASNIAADTYRAVIIGQKVS